MNWAYDLVIVNPYAETTYSIHTRKNVNVAIISLASYIYHQGYKVKILDYSTDEKYLKKLNDFLSKNPTKVIAVSSTSCFSYRTIQKIVEEVKISSKSVLIIGGQLIAGLGNRVFDIMPKLKYACFSEGEATLLHIIKHHSSDFLSAPALSYKDGDKIKHNPPQPLLLEEIGSFNYKLYPNYHNFVPTIEESRGCPYRCHFCVNNILNYKVRVKNWRIFVDEALRIYKLYGKDKLFISLGCSTFGMDEENTLKLFEALLPHKNKFSFQVWTRCDVEYERWMPHLKQPNISSVFFGMESASEEILMRMNKTRNPKQYIERSQHLINTFYENGLKLWCNFIFGYVGETPDTIYQTIDFILKNKDKIGYLSGHGLVAFPGNQIYEHFDALQKKYGISYDIKASYPDFLYYKVNPSVDFTSSQIDALAQVILKIVNTKEDFKRVYAWKWLGQNEDPSTLDEKIDYIKPHELPYKIVGTNYV